MGTSTDLNSQLQQYRRTVDFDTYDISAQQIMAMVEGKEIHIAPAYQRKFRWNDQRCSQLIESLLLGIPIPSLFTATNPDSTWELVDGVQRVSAIIKFMGTNELRDSLEITGELTLEGLEKLTQFNGYRFDELPSSIQLHLKNRPLKVVTLSDKSDLQVRFDLFERLNKGGVTLSDQEIRDCVYRGRFADFVERLSSSKDFNCVLKLTEAQEKSALREECVLRFFAFLNAYQNFEHSVVEFLNGYMGEASLDFDYERGEKEFFSTFRALAEIFPEGLRRPPAKKGTTSLIFYEGVSVGAALALRQATKLVSKNLKTWLESEILRKYTTGATNSRGAVIGRIEFCRDHFLSDVAKPSK